MAQIVVVLKSGEHVPFGPDNDPLYAWGTSEGGGLLTVFKTANGMKPKIVQQFQADDVDHVEGD
jgi:hypothetical protein